MSFWSRLERAFAQPPPFRRGFTFDAGVEATLSAVAQREGRSEQQVARDLLAFALERRAAHEENRRRWLLLTPRQQQVVALFCLGRSTRQIAGRLVVSHETVKTHLRNALIKFDLPDRTALRRALADWDFSGWE